MNTDEVNACPICFEGLLSVADLSQCCQSTSFCVQCIDRLDSCPNCRTPFVSAHQKWKTQVQDAKAQITNPFRESYSAPRPISDELAALLGKPAGTEMSRVDVTREFNQYIQRNNLKDKNSGRRIRPNDALKALFNLSDHDELTCFNMQKFLTPHFIKPSKTI